MRTGSDKTLLGCRWFEQCVWSHLDTVGFTRRTRQGILGPLLLWRSSMQKKRSAILTVGLFLVMATGLFAQSKEDSGMPKVGDMAPDFTLKHFDGNDLKDVKLSDYRGKKNVVLAFYIFAFTGG